MLKLENIHKFFEIGTVNEKHILKGVKPWSKWRRFYNNYWW